MIWADDFLLYFFQSFNEDIVCYFRDGMFGDSYDKDDTYFNMSTKSVSDQPENEVFMMIKFIRGNTEFSTIGNGIDKQKREPFTFNCRILTPKNKSNKRAYQIEHALDSIFLGFPNIVTSDYHVRLNQRIPKQATETTDPLQKIYDELEVNYRFITDYC